MSTTITIGREDGNTFQVQEEFSQVSRRHGQINAQEDGTMTFTDFSSRGTTVNGQKIHNATVPIQFGDEIILGDQCVLNWAIIGNFLPQQHQGKKTELFDQDNGKKTELFDQIQGKKTELFNKVTDRPVTSPEPQPLPGPIIPPQPKGKKYSASEIGREVRKWNWGAFLLNVIWAAFHKIHWPLYILAANLIITPLPLVIKEFEEILIIGGVITWIVHLALFVVAVYLGINGSEIAWNRNVCNKDLDLFKQKQQRWATAGLISWTILITALTILIITNL